MTALYYISILISMLASFGSIWFVKRKWSKIPFRKGVKYSDLAGVDIYKLFGSLKTSFADKKSAILIKLAQKGFIKIREDGMGSYCIDKLLSYDDEPEYSRKLLDRVFEDNVSYVGGEDAIMSYESVSWNDAKSRYRDSVQDIIDDAALANKMAGNPRGRKISVTKTHAWADLGIFFNWLFGIVPFAVATSYDEGMGMPLALLAVSMTVGFIMIIINACFACMKTITKELGKATDIFRKMPVLYYFILICGWGLKLFIGFFIGCAVLMWYSLLVVLEWTGPGVNLSSYYGLFLMVITIILIVMKKRRQRLEETSPENGYLSSEVLISSMLENSNIHGLIVDKEKYNSIMPYAYMYNKTKELEALNIADKGDKPDWYEGDNWMSMDKLMHDLDS